VAKVLEQQYRGCRLHCFGSYAAGIYLPTADMDLCFVSDEYANGGYPIFNLNRKTLRRFMDVLVQKGVAADDGQEVIVGAKVPIIKFIDARTRLRVDVSFENTTGITAVGTFNDWKQQFPAMPIMVTLLKQFLLMRGLGEVFSGGLGGFSITCLVVSLLQHMPAVQSGNMKPEHNLGEFLLEFLDFYGNCFNMETTAISMKPAGLFPKVSFYRQNCCADCSRPSLWIRDLTSPSYLLHCMPETEANTSSDYYRPEQEQHQQVVHHRSKQGR
jgi:non-canonical poly(A) RNA polymerase PAPD5/7